MSLHALELQGITKRFGPVTALDQATLLVRPGTVHALLGENGAGKTTLMRVAFGMVQPDGGSLIIEGTHAHLRSPRDAIAAGVGMVHQHFALVPTMTVAENVALGRGGRYSARHAADQVRRIGETSGLHLDPAALAGDLPVSGQQRLEIVKALSRDARILILDEPTAVLAPSEITELLGRLRAFADEGRTVVLITHKLREALAIADEVTVLRRGANVLSVPSSKASEAALVAAILGRTPGAVAAAEAELELLAGGTSAVQGPAASLRTDDYTKSVVDSAVLPTGFDHPGDPVVEVRAVSIDDSRGAPKIRDASFVVRRGEIVGVAAVEGAGHHELLRVLAGRLGQASGTVVRPDSIGFIPEDRQHEALVLDFSLTENVMLRGAGQRRGTIGWQAAAARTSELLGEFDVRAAGAQVAVSTLSGGNQQKLVLARELESTPDLLVAENPTRGLDIQAAALVHARLRATAIAGTAVVVHSTDLDELLALASRILVVFSGMVREVPHDRDAVGRGMLGLFAAAER